MTIDLAQENIFETTEGSSAKQTWFSGQRVLPDYWMNSLVWIACRDDRYAEPYSLFFWSPLESPGQQFDWLEHLDQTSVAIQPQDVSRCFQAVEWIKALEHNVANMVFGQYVVGEPWTAAIDPSELVAGLFGQISDVSAVYQAPLTDGILVWVFTDNPKYDDALMDRLLSIEDTILDSLPGIDISFRYVPSAFTDDNREVVGNSARLILER